MSAAGITPPHTTMSTGQTAPAAYTIKWNGHEMDARHRKTFNVDVNFLDSKEVLSIPVRQRSAAILLWLRVGTWSRRKNTDGRVSAAELRELRASPKLVHALICSTLWAIDPVTTPDVATALQTLSNSFATSLLPNIWDPRWKKWQISSEDIERARKADRKRQQRARSTAKNVATSDGIDVSRRDTIATPSDRNGHVTRDILTSANSVTALRDDMSRRDLKHREESKEKRGGLSTDVSPEGATQQPPLQEFPDHCQTHRHNPDPPPCGACGDTRRANAGAARQRVQADYFARAVAAERRRNCRVCSGTGLVPIEGSDPFDYDTVKKCPYCNQEDQ